MSAYKSLPAFHSWSVEKGTYGKPPTSQDDLFVAKAQPNKKPNWALKRREERFEKDVSFLSYYPIIFMLFILVSGSFV